MADWKLESPAGHFLLMETLGTSDPDFYNELMRALIRASTHGCQIDEQEINFLVSVIKGVEPKDQLETLLSMQMGTVHLLAMEFARRLNSAESIVQQDAAERAFNKLTRTFAAQMECLKRYRAKPEQKILVEHVAVHEGGKAIVAGNITHGGAGSTEKAG
jgi:hypothetical protein